MKILIIEDEKNAFEYLSMLIHKIRTDVEIFEQIESVEEAVNWIHSSPEPDLVFLDIELSDGLSFEIFQHVDLNVPVIFTTAYDQYAIEAFKLNSIGYLLKPVNKSELELVFNKYEKFSPSQFEAFGHQLNSIFNKVGRTKKQRCLIKKGDHFEFVQLSDIAYVHSEDGLTFLYTFSGKRHLYNYTIEKLSQELDHSQFFQINRGQIVNINAIDKMHPYFNQRMKLELEHTNKEHEFLVSRSKVQSFKQWIEG